MTVSSATNNETFDGNGATTIWPLPFRFFDNSDIKAYLLNPVTQETTLLTLGADYTLTGAGLPEQFGTAPGKITTMAPVATGRKLYVERVMEIEQLTDIVNQGRFFPEVHEDVFDRITMLIQQGFALTARALLRPVGKDYFDAEGRNISNVKDPVAEQDAATKGWAGRYFGDLIDGATGLINTTVGILYDAGTLFDYLRFGLTRRVNNIAALRVLSSARNQRATTLGFYARWDGGHAEYVVDETDTTSAESIPLIIVANDGARWKLVHDGEINSAQCGFKKDGSINTSAQVNAANAALRNANAVLKFIPGTWIMESVTVIDKMRWLGAGRVITKIQSKNGLNATLLSIPDIAVVKNANDIEIENLTFDGNRANNTSGGVIKIRGASPRIRKIDIVNSRDISMHTDWDQTDPATYSRLYGVEGTFSDIIVDKSGASGIIYDGPTDSSWTNITLKDCGLNATLTHFGMVINSSGRFDNLHPWNSGDLTIVPLASVSLGGFGGCNFVNSHFEGSQCPLKIQVGSNGNTFEGCQWYGTRGPYACEVYSTGNKIGGVIGGLAYAGNPNYKGMLLQGVGNDINLIDGGGATICAVEFAAGESNNRVSLVGYRTAGQPVMGNISSTDEIFINVSGGAGGTFVQHVKLAPTATARGVSSATGAIGSASATVAVLYDGKYIDWHCSLAITTIGTAGGDLQVSMPFTATRAYSVTAFENISGNAVRMTMNAGSSTLRIITLTNTFVGSNGMTIAGGGRCEFT